MVPQHPSKQSRPLTIRTAISLFAAFVWKEAVSCLFAVVIFISLAVTKYFAIPGLPRYDALLAITILTQVALYATKFETRDEVKVIFLFHFIGLSMELFKVHFGSWRYPAPGYTKVWGVPLYSGFMYSSIGSYIVQVWRRLELRLVRWPGPFLTIPLGILIYLNFFTDQFGIDLRWWLMLALLAVLFRTQVQFRLRDTDLRMPLLLSFLSVGFCIWLGENIATYLGAWQYPYQAAGWQMVTLNKIGSWSLLVIISFLIVAELKRVKEGDGVLLKR